MKIHLQKALFVVTTLLAGALLFAVACGSDNATNTSSPATILTETPAAGASYSFDCKADHAGTAPDASAFPVQIADDAGRTITLAKPPTAIASLSAGHTETLYAIGAGKQVKAVDKTSDCPVATARLPQADAFSPNIEAITTLAPDLVIIFFDPGDLASSLNSAGIPVIMLESPVSVDGVYDQIELLGRATGHVAESQALVASLGDAVDVIEAGLKGVDSGPSVFHEVDNTFYTAGSGSFVGDLYDILKADNIAASTGEAYPKMNQEAIINARPDVIILADEDAGESSATVKARPGWSAIPAVQNDRIYTIDPNIASRPGPRLVEALRTLAKFLYPDRFH